MTGFGVSRHSSAAAERLELVGGGSRTLADALARNAVAIPIEPPDPALVEIEFGLGTAVHFAAVALPLAGEARICRLLEAFC